MIGYALSPTSMDDYELTSIVERAERFRAEREVISRRPSEAFSRNTFGTCPTGRGGWPAH